MAKVRFIGDRELLVPELGDLLVQPDEIYTVPDERFEAYMLHPERWESIEEPPAPPAKKTAAKKTAAAKKTTTSDAPPATPPATSAAATTPAADAAAPNTTTGAES